MAAILQILGAIALAVILHVWLSNMDDEEASIADGEEVVRQIEAAIDNDLENTDN